MKPAKWDLRLAAAYGAVIGGLSNLARMYGSGEIEDAGTPFLIGSSIGGAVGGAALFLLGAVLINASKK